jgi:hypothetical protein
MNSDCGYAARSILVNSLAYIDSFINGQEHFQSFASFMTYAAKLNPFIATRSGAILSVAGIGPISFLPFSFY